MTDPVKLKARAQRRAPQKRTKLPVLLECGCAVNQAGSDAAVDPVIKKRNMSRLRRIEGQLRGIQKMIDEDRQCSDIVVQLASVSGALRGVSKDLVKHHLRHCVAHALLAGDDSGEAALNELVELFFPK